MHWTRFFSLSVVALLASGPTLAQVAAPDGITRIPVPFSVNKPTTAAEEAMVDYLRDVATPGDRLQDLTQTILTEHSEWLDAQKPDRRSKAAAVRRAVLSSLLRDDVNSDGRVTREELMIAGRFRVARSKEDGVSAAEYAAARLSEGDVDGDGVLSRADADALAGSSKSGAAQSEIPIVDPDGNGMMSNDELQSALRRALAWLDQDRDGQLSSRELGSKAVSQETAKPSTCDFPKIPQDAEIIGLYGKSGTGFTDLSFGSTPDQAVHKAVIVVPPGQEPVWIASSFDHAMVLRLSGASDRVAGLISVRATTGLAGHSNPVRVVAPKCENWAPLNDLLSRSGVRIFRAERFGRLTVRTGQNAISHLFEGDDTPEAEGAARHAKLALYHFSPGGFHDYSLDEVALPSDITASERALWPFEAGLLQLMEQGSLLPVTTSRSGVIRRLAPGSPLPVQATQSTQSTTPGWVYTKTEDGGWVGREPLTFYAMGDIAELPVGLSGARRIILAATN